jgi:hypothetical protein
MAYFFFDFKDTGKQDARALLSSLLIQLSYQSDVSSDILLALYSAHRHGAQQPTAVIGNLHSASRICSGPQDKYQSISSLMPSTSVPTRPACRDSIRVDEATVASVLRGMHACDSNLNLEMGYHAIQRLYLLESNHQYRLGRHVRHV